MDRRADLDLTLGFQALGQDAQGYPLAGTGINVDQSNAGLVDEAVLDAPAELLQARVYLQGLDQDLGG